MVETWRLLDTGLASAARNIALSRALLEACAADEIPGTLRFLRTAPSVLIGCRQSAAQEADLAECRAQAIAVQRRMTGGKTWFVDERQLGWELHLHRREVGSADMRAMAQRTGHAAATALAALGIEARYRERDEIEVGGRAVCAMAGAIEGGGVLLQGALLISPDYARMARVLRLPAGSSGEAAIAAVRARVAGVADVLGRRVDVGLIRRNLIEAFESEFEIELREGDLTLTEEARYARALAEVETAGWVDLVAGPASDMPLLEAERAVRGGLLRAALKYERSSRMIRQIWFSGDFDEASQHALHALEAALCDCAMERLARQVERFFAARPGCTRRVEAGDFVAVVKLAVGESLAA